MTAPRYAELHARSAFSFLRGASTPESLARRAAEIGLPALALCDRDGVQGAPRLHGACRDAGGVRALVGAELTLEDDSVLPVLVETRRGYQMLCRLLTDAHLRSIEPAHPSPAAPRRRGEDAPPARLHPPARRQPRVRLEELAPLAPDIIALSGDEEGPLRRAWAAGGPTALAAAADRVAGWFPRGRFYVEIQRHDLRGEERWNRDLVALARARRLPLVATQGVLYAEEAGREVLDVFTCLRHHTTIDEAGRRLAAHGGRHLRSPAEMVARFADLPEATEATIVLAERLGFSLRDLGYAFPRYPVPAGETMDSFLHRLAWFGAEQRYGSVTPAVRAQLERELELIARLGFSGYFLIVWDLVSFARERGILIQGRGSAANSAVCYSLGITAVDPVGGRLLFERFLSEGREGWPDIDLDLPSGEGREQVIQEVYRRYGPRGAAMTANVITYRGRSSARELGKVLGLPTDLIDRFNGLYAGGDYPHTLGLEEQLAQAGLEQAHPRARALVRLFSALRRLPRHLGQHSGGMIIADQGLDTIVPLQPAAMPGRVIAQWDKDDCEDLGIIKVDLLGLGMMAVLQDCLALTRNRGRPVDLAHLPKDDPATFELLRRADTLGTFQVESRAQMATLPRLQPRVFYDLVIEVALIRPGPIQGRLVNPYLDRRSGRAPVTYLHPDVRPVLERTLGVPLFQEQVLKIAMVLAGFSGAEAEELRRALGFHRSEERMEKVERKLRTALAARGHSLDVIEEVGRSIRSFALYGFPESHAISFALIAYASCWLKVHRAAEFYASLLNHQPMGFYAPASIVQDARRHGIRTLPPCVIASGSGCTIEDDSTLRLGLGMVRGLSQAAAARIVAWREGLRAVPPRLADFLTATRLTLPERRALAAVGALNALAGHRRAALWAIETSPDPDGLPGLEEGGDGPSPLPAMSTGERLRADFHGTGLTVGAHPMAHLRPALPGAWRAIDLALATPGSRIELSGAVICRQRPGTARGVVFVSLEDETGIANIICHPDFFERHRLVLTHEPFLTFRGRLQNEAGVIHLLAEAVAPLEAAQRTNIPAADPHHFH